MINKWQFCAPKLAKRANYASSAFFGNTCIESYARNDELCRKLCQQNLSNPSCPPWGVWIFSGTTHCTIVSLQNNNSKWRERFLVTGTHWIGSSCKFHLSLIYTKFLSIYPFCPPPLCNENFTCSNTFWKCTANYYTIIHTWYYFQLDCRTPEDTPGIVFVAEPVTAIHPLISICNVKNGDHEICSAFCLGFPFLNFILLTGF